MGSTDKQWHKERPTNTYYHSLNKNYRFDTKIKLQEITEQDSSYALPFSLLTIAKNDFSVEACSTKIEEVHLMSSYVLTF